MLSLKKNELFEKYAKGRKIDDEDIDDIYEFASIGLARVGFKSTKNGEMKETARLTPLGLSMYETERNLENPIKRFIYSFIHS